MPLPDDQDRIAAAVASALQQREMAELAKGQETIIKDVAEVKGLIGGIATEQTNQRLRLEALEKRQADTVEADKSKVSAWSAMLPGIVQQVLSALIISGIVLTAINLKGATP